MDKRNFRFIFLLCSLLLRCGIACAAPASTSAALSVADQTDIDRITHYLDNLRTLQGKFYQIANNGVVAEGKFYLSRPGKLRFEYDPPAQILLVTKGSSLVYHDKSLNSANYIPVDSTPLGFLLKDRIVFDHDIVIDKIERSADTINLKLRQRGKEDIGALTLTFSDHPLTLAQWTVFDAQNQRTQVTLQDVEINQPVADSVFRFTDPHEAVEH